MGNSLDSLINRTVATCIALDDGGIQNLIITFTDGSSLTVDASSIGCCGCELDIEFTDCPG